MSSSSRPKASSLEPLQEAAVQEPFKEPQSCGYIALLGAPNAGKSTLLNALVGQKLSIVTPKRQTTRSRVLGIVMSGAAQLIFIDTPGIFTPHSQRRLERAMVAAAWEGAKEADIVCLLHDVATRDEGAATLAIAQNLASLGHKIVLLLNKIDNLPRHHLLPITERFQQSGYFADVFMISALKGDGIEDVRRFLARQMPAGAWLFPPDQLTDMPQRLWAAEIIREQLFMKLHQELPYNLYVETEKWQELADGGVRIDAVIFVARQAHKPIVLGKGGEHIKRIGAGARQELIALLERPVHLFLFVKVRSGWGEQRAAYETMGLSYDV
jgi:GTPase